MKTPVEVYEAVRGLLRQHGWEAGYKKVQAELETAASDEERAVREAFLGWMAAARGHFDHAERHFQAIGHVPGLAAWGAVGQSFVAMREKNFALAHTCLDQATRLADGADSLLQATLTHNRGTLRYHEGNSVEAERLLLQALRDYGEHRLGVGRVLDTLGMLYADRDNFHAAREFFLRSIKVKEQWQDLPGVALSHGQLGRLYLDWGNWDKAEHHFQEDLRLVEQIGDERGQAQLYNHLAQVALARGEHEAAFGRTEAAHRYWAAAAGWLDASIRRSQAGQWTVLEAYARKDRALVFLLEEKPAEAEMQLQEAQRLFGGLNFKEGLAHVHRAWGILGRQRGQWDESLRALHTALESWQETKVTTEVARTRLERARTLAAAGEPAALVIQTLREALRSAEACRRAELVERIETELRCLDPEAYWSHLFQRVRGRAVTEGATSLLSGSRETGTVLYLDLKGSTEYALGRDPEDVMMTINQMMAESVAVLRRYDARVSAFRGDGFLALLRGPDHALRAVHAGLDLTQAIVAFNAPREVLGLPLFTTRVGIATGELFFGNVGTYDKMDYTALGTTANLGARLESAAQPGYPCISQATYEMVRDRFNYREGSPRKCELKGLGEHLMWDVKEVAPRPEEGPSPDTPSKS
jgi:class 3 adenylate cyclase